MNSSFKSEFELHKLLSIKQLFLLIIGVCLAVFALKGFMIPNRFLDGGVTGISILLHEKFHISFSLIFISINLLFLIPTYFKLGRYFAIRSTIVSILTVILFQMIEIQPVTSDKLLIAIFGGCILGLGVGLIARTGSALDGFEILAESATKRIGFSISEVILFFNSILFLIAAYEFGIEAAMYSMITYFAALKTFDYVVDGIEEFISLTIVSSESDIIKRMLVEEFNKGITVYKGEKGFLPGSYDISSKCDIIMTIVSRFELIEIKNRITEIEEKAFLYTYKIKETKGGIIKKPNVHH